MKKPRAPFDFPKPIVITQQKPQVQLDSGKQINWFKFYYRKQNP